MIRTSWGFVLLVALPGLAVAQQPSLPIAHGIATHRRGSVVNDVGRGGQSGSAATPDGRVTAGSRAFGEAMGPAEAAQPAEPASPGHPATPAIPAVPASPTGAAHRGGASDNHRP